MVLIDVSNVSSFLDGIFSVRFRVQPAAVGGVRGNHRVRWLAECEAKSQEDRLESSFSSLTETGMERSRHKWTDARSIILITCHCKTQ